MQGRETTLEGFAYELDPAGEMWVARAVHLRHLVETDWEGVPLSPAPPAGDRPARLSQNPAHLTDGV